MYFMYFFFFFQAEDGIRDLTVTGVQTCALPQRALPVWRGLQHSERRIVADDSGAMAGRTLVPRPRERHRPPLGTLAGNQAAGSPGAERSDVYVVSGDEPSRSQVGRNRGRHARSASPSRDRL